jgi:ABC-type xylose transport system permease subunit
VADFKALPDPASRGRVMVAALKVGRAMLVGGASVYGGWGVVVEGARAALEEGKW